MSATSPKMPLYEGVGGKKCCQAARGENKDIIVKRTKYFPFRYVIKEVLGMGAYGIVLRAYDKISKCDVAIKFIQERYNQSKAYVEVEHLKLLNEMDVLGDQHIVRLKDYFMYGEDLYMVFEIMDLDLCKRLGQETWGGLSLNKTRRYASQMCIALNFLSLPEIGLIHGDLKPDNLLLSGLEYHTLKVADFGLSCRRARCNEPVQCLFYRAPEVILGFPYTMAIDMWSFACIVVEMHTNEPLFKGSSTHMVIGKMVEVLGVPPKRMLDIAPNCFKYFDIHPTTGMYSLKDKGIVPGSKTLEDILGAENGGPNGKWRGRIGHAPATYKVFIDFLKKILVYWPEERWRPSQALSHDFFKWGAGVPPQPIPHLTKPRPLKESTKRQLMLQRRLEQSKSCVSSGSSLCGGN